MTRQLDNPLRTVRFSQTLPTGTSNWFLLDAGDLGRLEEFALERRVDARHVLLAGVVALLCRHAEFGPVAAGGVLPADSGDSFRDVLETVMAAGEAAEVGQGASGCIEVVVPADWATRGPGRALAVVPVPGDGVMLEAADGNAVDPVTLSVFRRLRPLLEGALAVPDTPIGRLPLLTHGERHEVLTAWNATECPLPPLPCAHQLFEAQVARTPDAVAVQFGAESLTYRELDARANRLARRLRGLGVGPDVLVGICLERSTEMLVTLLAALKAGGAYLPLDPNYPVDRLTYMLEDSRARVVVTTRRLDERLALRAPEVLRLDEEPIHPDCDAPADVPDCHAGGSNLCYVLYTSGSTGKPKGVEIPHRAMVNFLATMADEPGLGPADVVLAVTTLSFDIAGLELLLPLTVGARTVILPRELAVDGMALRRVVEASEGAVLQGTPATWRMLLSAGWQGTRGLRMFCGGEAMSVDLARALLARGAELWNMYGPTETTVYSTVYRVNGDEPRVPIGRPVANTRCYVLDAHRRPVPPGMVGELYIGGEGLARGYRNRPDLTAERFFADPFARRRGARMYKTGDVCRYVPDGQIEYLGRNDQQVKINGFRIELQEVEAALVKQAGVAEAVVVADVPEEDGRSSRLVAYVRGKAGKAGPDVAAVRAGARATLAPHMVPALVVAVPNFPLTPAGKVDRKALAAAYLVPAGARAAASHDGGVESRLLAIWRDVLRLPAVGRDEPFMELGGDSLQAVELAVRVEKEFGKVIPVAHLMGRAATVAGMAEVIMGADAQAGVAGSLVVPLRPGAAGRQGLFFFPGAGGHCLSFQAVARVLPDGLPVYGLNLPVPAEKVPGSYDIPVVAERMVREVRAVQPEGPYHLSGYSFGALLAYEIAAQLVHQGQEVATLVLIDGYGPGYPGRRGPARRAWEHARRLWRGDRTGRLAYWRERAPKWLGGHGAAAEAPPVIDSIVEQEVADAWKGYAAAERRYVHPTRSGPAVLFRAAVTPDWAGSDFTDRENGWGTVVFGGVEVFEVACDHRALFGASIAAEWGRQLAAVLRRTMRLA